MSRGTLTIAEIAERVYYAIASAAYAGAVAPKHSEMAARFFVAESSVWQAVERLHRAGIIVRRKVQVKGSGNGARHCSVYRIVATGKETLGFDTGEPVAPPFVRLPRAYQKTDAWFHARGGTRLLSTTAD